MPSHDDDKAVIQANRYIATSKDRQTAELVRDLKHRIEGKKVEIRGLEGQISSLQAKVAELKMKLELRDDQVAEYDKTIKEMKVVLDDDPTQK